MSSFPKTNKVTATPTFCSNWPGAQMCEKKAFCPPHFTFFFLHCLRSLLNCTTWLYFKGCSGRWLKPGSSSKQWSGQIHSVSPHTSAPHFWLGLTLNWIFTAGYSDSWITSSTTVMKQTWKYWLHNIFGQFQKTTKIKKLGRWKTTSIACLEKDYCWKILSRRAANSPKIWAVSIGHIFWYRKVHQHNTFI